MNKPNQKDSKYYQGHIFLDRQYIDDTKEYIDFVENELQKERLINLSYLEQKKELVEEMDRMFEAIEELNDKNKDLIEICTKLIDADKRESVFETIEWTAELEHYLNNLKK